MTIKLKSKNIFYVYNFNFYISSHLIQFFGFTLWLRSPDTTPSQLTACVALWLIQAILTTFHFITMLLCRCCSLLAMLLFPPHNIHPLSVLDSRFLIFFFFFLCCVAPTEKKCNNVYLCPVYSVKE